jgi:hypothetical protein
VLLKDDTLALMETLILLFDLLAEIHNKICSIYLEPLMLLSSSLGLLIAL